MNGPNKLECFLFLWKVFHNTAIFASKAGAYLSGAPLYDRLLALPKNIKQD
jgi:hypothetical protein